MDYWIIASIICSVAAIIAITLGLARRNDNLIFIALFIILITVALLIFNLILKKAPVENESESLSNGEPAVSVVVPQWGPWSEWTKDPPTENSTRIIDKRSKTIGYVMTVYVTQENVPPYYRSFRDFSIENDFETYGARESYAEKHFEIQVTPEQFDSATAYEPGDHINNNDLYVGGYNKSAKTAYVMEIALDGQGRYYPLFIKEELKETEYRYRDMK